MHPDLVIFAGNTGLLLLIFLRSRTTSVAHSGNMYLILGFGLVSLIALTNYFITTSDIPLEILSRDPEKFTAIVLIFFYLPAVFLIGLGFLKWFEASQRIMLDSKRRASTEERLQGRIDQLKDALKIANSINKSKSDFLINISHEMRTELTSIIGFSEGMSAEIHGRMSNNTYLEHADLIHSSGQGMFKMLTRVLDLSKAEAGHIDLEEEAFFLRALIKETLSGMEAEATLKGVQLQYQGEEEHKSDTVLWADRRLIKQVLLNLISNAVTFTPAGGSITIRSFLGNEDSLIIEIIDTGEGMEADEIPQALDPYQRIGNPMVRSNISNGLGLALVKMFMELHDGTVQLFSSPGKGTTARLTFPNTRGIKPETDTNSL